VRCSCLALLALLLALLPGRALADPQDSWSEHLGAQRRAQIDGQELAWLDRGSGPAILLVHGVPTSSWSYRELAALLAERGYRVVAPDLVGFGASAKPEDPAAFGLGVQSERLLALMDRLELESFTVVCHDMGGLVTWELLERAPERVERLVVLNTLAFEEGWNPRADLARQERLRRIVEAVSRSDRRAMALTRALVTEGLEDRSIGRDEVVIEGYYRPLSAGAGLAMLALSSSLDQVRADLPRYQATLRALDLPAMIIWGAEDEILLAEEQAPRLAALLEVPMDRVHLLEDGKHTIQEDNAPEIADLVDAFMGSTP
jgi:haloalkane dehalogenase